MGTISYSIILFSVTGELTRNSHQTVHTMPGNRTMWARRSEIQFHIHFVSVSSIADWLLINKAYVSSKQANELDKPL